MKKFQSYLFDFDGTLVDSMPAYERAMKGILGDLKVAYGPDLMREITPLGVLETAHYFVEKLSAPCTEGEILRQMEKRMSDAYFYHIPAKGHVVSTLRALSRRGIGLFVLTASPHLTLDPCLERLGIFDLFSGVFSCDDFHLTKADEALYPAAAEKMGCSPEKILFFDDQFTPLQCAKKAGLSTCGVFDPSARDQKDLIRRNADFYIEDFSQLLDF